jgi:hypothetical protein
MAKIIQLVIGAIATWLILVFLNETYKEVLRELGLPAKLVQGTIKYYRATSNKLREAHSLVTADDNPTVRVDPKTDLQTSRRRIRRYALPPQVVIISLVIIASITLISNREVGVDVGVGIFFAILTSTYLLIFVIGFIILEAIWRMQIKQENFARFGRLRRYLTTFMWLPYIIATELITAALGCLIMIVVLWLAVMFLTFLVWAILGYLTR